MTAPSTQRTPTGTDQPLAEAIVAFAETPDDMPDINTALENVARLAADRIAAVDYAAVVPRPDDGSCTVATSGEFAESVSSCADSEQLDRGIAAVPTMAWPGFRDTAADMGLGLVSMPLFTGSGATIATLDLYGRDMAEMAPLTAGICAAFDPDLPWPPEGGDLRALDAGGEELVAGFAEALSVRSTIQFAVTMITKSEQVDSQGAYLRLRVRAADRGVSLMTAATDVITFGLN